MVTVRGSKLNLPNPSLSSPTVTSLAFDPHSRSLALSHTDSSFSLYHSLSPLSSSLLPQHRTVIPPPSSSSCFVSIQSSDSLPLFVVAGPQGGGSKICLRFFAVVEGKGFARVRAVCNQKGIAFDDTSGVLIDCFHGVSVRLAGSANFFAVNWISGSEIWVFAVKMVGDGIVKLMRCAVIECRKPVFSIGFCFGLLVLGEENGVRVFSLRQLVKGRVRKVNALQKGQKFRVPDGGHNCERNSEIDCKCRSNEKNGGNVPGKYRATRLQQESCEVGTYFVVFGDKDVEVSSKSRVKSLLKATSIQTLSSKRCLVLDSAGNLHDLYLSSTTTGSGMVPRMRRLPRVMNVQKFAVLAENSRETQTIWVSDGYNSLHVISINGIEAVLNETESTEAENSLQISVMQTIFSCEKIEDVAPLAGNAVLILGQGSLYAILKQRTLLSNLRPVSGAADTDALFQFMHFFSWLLGSLACFCFNIHDLLSSHYENDIETAKPIKGKQSLKKLFCIVILTPSPPDS